MNSWSERKKYVEVGGQQMAYIEEGHGDPIVFLHGNPTSSYLWRNVMPHLSGQGRLLAPDLIGMGDSSKLTDTDASSYTFVEHRKYLDGWFEAMGLTENVTLVIHDWGSGLGFDWANRHRDAVKGIAYMEAIVRPTDWARFAPAATDMFKALRSDAGEEMVLQKNLFVEAILPRSIQRDLSDDEMAEYRRPFTEAGESRRPTLTWPRQIPIDGEPEDVSAIVNSYATWLETAAVPKLLFSATPGAILAGEQLEYCRSWANQTEVAINGIHFVQEDSPDEIGQAISDWVTGL